MALFGMLITRDDDLIVRQWFERHAGLFDMLAVLDGSRSDVTKDVALSYPNVIYMRDPEGAMKFNDQTLRSACWGLLDPLAKAGDWVVVCHCDEFFYHSPAKLIEKATPDVNSIVWEALHIMPHPSEKESILSQVDATGHYDPITTFTHFWYKQDPETKKFSSSREYRMFKVPANGVKWGNSNGWVLPINLGGEHVTKQWRDKVIEYDKPTRMRPFPVYFHYKLYNLDLDQFSGDSSYFEKSRLGTGVGGRVIKSFDDLFFGGDRPWNHKDATVCEQFTGSLPDGHVMNRAGNELRL